LLGARVCGGSLFPSHLRGSLVSVVFSEDLVDELLSLGYFFLFFEGGNFRRRGAAIIMTQLASFVDAFTRVRLEVVIVHAA